MAGFKNGAVAIKKKDTGINADPNFINILVDTSNNLYTIDEFGVYRSIAGYDVVSSGSDISVVTSGGTKVLSLNSTGVVSGTYGTSTTVPQIIIDNKGRILSAFSIPISASGLGTVTSISISSNTLNVINSPITTFGTFGVNLSATGVVSGSILKPFVDSYGRVLSGGTISATDISDRSTDTSLSANSDNKIPTEKAIKTYVDTKRLYVSTGISVEPPPNFVNNNNGTLTIEPTTCRLYSTTDFTGSLNEYTIAGTTLALTDGIEQHVCIKYNGGSPIYYVENSDTNINDSNIICVYIVWRQGLEIHSMGMDSLGLGLGNKTLHAINNTTPYRKSYLGGLLISETATPTPRTVLVTSGDVYAGVVEQPVLSFNSSVDRLTLTYHNSGVWNYVDTSAYNNTQYDNGTNLATISNNKYVVRWFYRSVGDVKQTFYVLGSGQYQNVSDARLEMPRTDLPMLLLRHCILIGRSIIQYNATNGITEPISDISFSSSVVQSHNDLGNIQGGDPAGNYYHVSASTFGYLSAVSADIQTQLNSKINFSTISALQEPTGFVDKNQTMSFNNSTRTFNISASGGFNVYYRGNVFVKNSDSITITNTSGLHFIYYTSAGILVESTTPWDISTTIQVALVYWTGTSSFGLCEERHGTVMDWATHQYNHKNFGTRYTSGLNASYVLNNDTSAYFGISNGTISDEDIELNITNGSSGTYLSQQINYIGYIPVYYRSGIDGNGTWRKDNATQFPYKNNGGTGINFNQLSAGNWLQTAATTTNFVAYYIYATNIINEPVISIQGQRQDTSLVNAQNNNTPNSLIFADFPSQEAKLLYRIILQTNPSYTGNIYRAQIVDVTDYRNSSTNLTNTGGSGTVTYVGLSANPILTVAGSPITNAGSFVLDFSQQSSGTFLSGPISGTSAIPTFRQIQFSDLPINSLSNNYLPLSGGTLTGLLSGTNISISGAVDAGVSRLQPSKVSNGEAWFGYAGKNNAGAYIGYYATSAGDVRVAAADTRSAYFGNGSNYSILTLNNSGAIFSTSVSANAGLTCNGWLVLPLSIVRPHFSDSTYQTMYGSGVIASNNNFSFAMRQDGYKTLLNSTNITTLAVNNIDQLSVTSAGVSASNLTAISFIKSGGTSSQFLKADGSVDSTSYATTASVSRPTNEIVLGSGSGLTSSPYFYTYASGGYFGLVISGTSSPLGQAISFNSQTNSNSNWLVQKRDAGDYSTTVGCFLIEDAYAGLVSARFPMVIDAGANGNIYFRRNASFSGNGSFNGAVDAGLSRIQSSLVSNGEAWFGYAGKNNAGSYIGYYANSASDVRIAAGDTRSVSIGNGSNYSILTLNNSGAVFSTTVSASNFYSNGNYYVSNYPVAGTPSLITNTGNARFYTLTLNDMNVTTDSSLKFLDAGLGATGGTFFSNAGKTNAIQIRGMGNSYFGGLYFGNNNTEYIGTKADNNLYLAASNMLKIDSVLGYITTQGLMEISSLYNTVTIGGNASILSGTSNVHIQSPSIDITATNNLTLNNYNTNGIQLNTYGYVNANATSGVYSNSYSAPKLNVSAISVTAAGLSISQIPNGYDFYSLDQPTGSNFKNYRLPKLGVGICKTIICFLGLSGPINHPLIYPPVGDSLYDSTGNIISYYNSGSNGGTVSFSFDGSNWWVS